MVNVPVSKRNYKKEAAQHAEPAQAARHRERMKDRYDAEKSGRVQKHDGKHLDHMNPNGKSGSLGKRTQVISKTANLRKGHPGK
jgi:hypothetical protein